MTTLNRAFPLRSVPRLLKIMNKIMQITVYILPVLLKMGKILRQIKRLQGLTRNFTKNLRQKWTLKRSKEILFIEQATKTKNCYRYTGLSKDKLLLIYEFVEEKARSIRYWKGSVDTTQPKNKKKNLQRVLTPWEELVLTLG